MARRTRAFIPLFAVPILFSMMILLRSRDNDGHMRHVFAAEKHMPADLPSARYGISGGMAIPDREVTPGEVDSGVEADASGKSWIVNGVEKNICARHFSATAIRKKIRNFAKLKREACEEYGVADKCDRRVEGDHLISIELGGCADCLSNLWPQPMKDARIKDHQVEDALPKLICAGQISLKDAQKCIASDWVKCAERVKKLQEEE